MKIYKLRILLFVPLMMFINFSSGQNFKKLKQTTDTTYGYSINNPLKLKKGNPVESIGNSEEFLKGLKTANDQNLIMVKRGGVIDPNYKEPPGDIASSLGDGGILDRYEFVTSVTKDTIVLYVDIYHKDKLMIPMGLKYVNP